MCGIGTFEYCTALLLIIKPMQLQRYQLIFRVYSNLHVYLKLTG